MDEWVESLDKDIISIVIPTYNRPDYLKNCLQHIKNNVYKDIQLIVVDDGSSCKFINKNIYDFYSIDTIDSKYIYLEKNTGGVSLPRNIGISHIIGRTIAPTDDDCYPQPRKFDSLHKALWENDNNILSFGGRLEYTIDKLGDAQFVKYVKCDFLPNNKTCLGLDNGQFLYKVDVYKYVNPSISINACDYHLYSSFAPHGDFVFVDEPVCSYLWHGKNISLTPKAQRKDPTLLIGNYLHYFKDGPFKEKVKSLI